MCWISRKEPKIKIAGEDIHVLKACFVIDCPKSEIYSVYEKYPYTLGIETAPIPFDWDITFAFVSNEYEIYRGYHSYNPQKVSIRWSADKRLLEIKNDEGVLDHFIFNETLKIIECVIPRGSKYCENEQGEIVSERIKPIKIKEIE